MTDTRTVLRWGVVLVVALTTIIVVVQVASPSLRCGREEHRQYEALVPHAEAALAQVEHGVLVRSGSCEDGAGASAVAIAPVGRWSTPNDGYAYFESRGWSTGDSGAVDPHGAVQVDVERITDGDDQAVVARFSLVS